MTEAVWRKCSTCKQPIAVGATYFVCSVSTCTRRDTNFAFCAVDCWDAHVPMMRHKEAYAVEKTAPDPRATPDAPSAPRPAASPAREPRRLVATEPTRRVVTPRDDGLDPAPDPEILVVASKVKAYIRARSGMNVSANTMDALSEHIRRLCDQSIRAARQAERKTVMDRDVPPTK
jgi:histone H3/H4